MNWVGGSRRRNIKNKEDTIKQKAFFQKQRLKRKGNNLDSNTSPKGSNTGNVDLLTLFIVNQIASKKEHTGKPKINRLFRAKGPSKTLTEPVELPMSPCSPSNVTLVASQPQYSVDTLGLKNRKHHQSEEFKFMPDQEASLVYPQLSPLLESNLSDASGSDSQHHIVNSINPFSSASTSSKDPFSIQPRSTPHVSFSQPSWENLDHERMKFVPFSQPMKLANPWTNASDEARLPHKSSVAGIQFGSTLSNTDTEELPVHSVMYPPRPLKNSEQQEEPLFLDFSSRDCEDQENSHTEKTIQIFLETTTLSSSTRVQNSAESQNMDHNSHFLTQASACIDCNTSGAVVGSNGFEHVCESTGGGYLSSDDDEDDEQCLHCVSSIKPICHAEETLVSKHCCSSANKSTARPSQDPSCKQKAKSNCNCQNETEAQTHNENNENSRMTQDAGTQTAAVPALSCQDVSVQCSLIYADSHSSSSFPAADQKTSVPTTRRQSFHFNGLLTPTTRSSPKDGNTRAGKILLGASATNEQAQRLPKSQIDFYFRKPQSQASMKRPPTPILGKTIIKASELKEEQQLESRMKIKRCGGPQLESVTQNSVKDVGRAEESVKEKKNFTADRGVNWVSEETKKLQEIADILLMLKQRKK